jgi:hypothetical protein
MTKKKEILKALIKGKSLTTLDGVKMFNTVKLNTRIGELEKDLQFLCLRTPQENKKTKTHYLRYSLPTITAAQRKRINNYLNV